MGKTMYDLTTPQMNIWNLHKYYDCTSIANQCGAVLFNDERNIDFLHDALIDVIRKHSAFRLRVIQVDGKIQQYFENEEKPNISVVNFENESELDAYANKLSRQPVTAIGEPLYRFEVFRIKDGRTGILAFLSHLIADAWSFSLLIREVNQIFENNQDIKNRNEKTDYLEFIRMEEQYLSSRRFKIDGLFWEKKYSSGFDISSIKAKKSVVNTGEARRIKRFLSAEMDRRLDSFCAEYALSPAVIFETALFIYLKMINKDNRNVTLGTLIFNRSHMNEKKTIGMFVSTIPITIEADAAKTIKMLIEDVKNTHHQIFRHQRYPYSEIVRGLHKKVGDSVYDIMLSVQNTQTDSDAETRWYSNGYSEVPLTIHVDNRDGRGRLFTVDYQNAIIRDPKEVELLILRIEHILQQILININMRIGEVSIVPESEIKLLIEEFNDTYIEYSKEKCIQNLLKEQVLRTPYSIALTFEGKSFSYKEFHEMTNTLAWLLRNKGVQRNEIVPIIGKRSWHTIVAMIGIIKSGGAFLSIDRTTPKERVEYIFSKIKASITLMLDFDYKDIKANCEWINLEDIDYYGDTKDIPCVNNPEDLCYAIFTSGSTGEPKGLMIRHRNAVNFCDTNRFNISNRIIKKQYHTFLSITNTVFDMFITELLVSLTHGMQILFASEKECIDSTELAVLCNKYSPDIIETTPTKLKMLLDNSSDASFLSSLKAIILGGESLPESFFQKLKQLTDAEVFNNYGPAETTVWSTISKVERSDCISIGSPIANTQIYIVDKEDIIVPVGVPGEICIAGDGVGKGYINNKKLTDDKFVLNPFRTVQNRHGKTMYHTGDLACWCVNGEIDYLGRIDTQVKVRGLRIELEEIENIMMTCPGILLAAASVKKYDDKQFLIGYYTSDSDIDEKELRRLLLVKLPRYMVPNYFMKLAFMPLTMGGKTDRKSLPTPTNFGHSNIVFVEPSTKEEILLCSIFAETLSLDRVGIDDDFFELGGDSLSAISFITKAHDVGMEIDLQKIFDFPTVRELCLCLKSDFKMDRSKSDDDELWSEAKRFKSVLMPSFPEKEHLEKRNLGNVFLTGATGFLGIHILDSLMKEGVKTIYCLVRKGHNEQCDYLLKTLQYYFGDEYSKEIGKRIIPVYGDVEKETIAEELPSDISTVIHAAATVKHYGDYKTFHRINVEGTKHIIDYSKRIGANLYHISTISVSGNSFAESEGSSFQHKDIVFEEKDFYVGQPLENVYVRSKFEAERLVLEAISEESIKAKIIRVGNLTNREKDYVFQHNYQSNSFLKRLKAIIELGLFPDYILPLYAEFTPVDKTAEGIVIIAQHETAHAVYHLYNNKPMYFKRMIEILNNNGIQMKVVDEGSFYQALEQASHDTKREYIYQAFQNDLDKKSRKLIYNNRIQVKNDFTVSVMSRMGFEWSEIDETYLMGYIEYFRKVGHLNV